MQSLVATSSTKSTVGHGDSHLFILLDLVIPPRRPYLSFAILLSSLSWYLVVTGYHGGE